MSVEYYGYDNCTSCKNAEGMLKEAGVPFAKREIFKRRLDADEIRALFNRIGISPGEMLSTRSRPYKELNLAERELSDDEIVSLMAEYPALIRRPVIVAGDEFQVGFNRGKLGSLIERSIEGGDANA
jgi:regulatory protein spx